MIAVPVYRCTCANLYIRNIIIEVVIIIMNYYRCKRILIFRMKYNMYNVYMHVNILIITIMYNGFIIVYMYNNR